MNKTSSSRNQGISILAALLIGTSILATLIKCADLGGLSPSKAFERISPSVVIVEYYGCPLSYYGVAPLALGSGVVVHSQEVVTNQHVILRYPGIIRVRQGKQHWCAFVKYMDRANDLCVLSVPGLSAPAVQVANAARVKVGDRVYAIGSPEGLELTLSEGFVSGLRVISEESKTQVIQTTAAISHGSSGGGLFDRHGALIGITTAFLSGGQNLNFAIPSDLVSEAISKAQLPCYGLLAKAAACLQAAEPETRCSEGMRSDLYPAYESDEAKKLLVRVKETCPKIPEVWYLLGLLQDATLLDRLEFYNKAVHLEPRFSESWCRLSWLHMRLAVTAVGEWRKSKENQEIWQDMRRRFGVVALLNWIPPAARMKYELAHDYMLKAVELRPDDTRYLNSMAEIDFDLDW